MYVDTMKATISISVDSEYLQLMKSRGINPSKWFGEKMKNEFKTKEEIAIELQDKIKQDQEKLVLLNNQIIEEKINMETKLNNLSEAQKEELINSKRILDRDASFFDGRYNRYKNLFNKKLQQEEFRDLLNAIKL